jgi:hypothetical protein
LLCYGYFFTLFKGRIDELVWLVDYDVCKVKNNKEIQAGIRKNSRLLHPYIIDMYDSSNFTLSWKQFKGEINAVCGSKYHYTQLINNS